MKTLKTITDLNPAIEYFGTVKALADAINVKAGAVTNWKRRGLDAERAVEISKATKGKVKPSQLLKNFHWS